MGLYGCAPMRAIYPGHLDYLGSPTVHVCVCPTLGPTPLAAVSLWAGLPYTSSATMYNAGGDAIGTYRAGCRPLADAQNFSAPYNWAAENTLLVVNIDAIYPAREASSKSANRAATKVA